MKVETQVDLGPGPQHETAYDGYEVYRWPEFQALFKRLGVAIDQPTTAITFRVGMDEVVKIVHEYNGQDMTKPKET